MPDCFSFDSPALILGATGTIGRAIGKRLVAAGVFVVGVARYKQAHAGEPCWSKLVTGDLAEAGFLELLATNLQQAKIEPAILVHSAGQYCATVPPTREDERMVMEVNLHSARRATDLFGTLMRQRKSGRILLIGSIAALRGSRCRPYAKSKAALLYFVKQRCAELARTGVTLNVLLPGPVESPFFQKTCDECRRQEYLRDIPMARFATADDVAATAAFLVSGEAGYLTGAAIPLSGGLI